MRFGGSFAFVAEPVCRRSLPQRRTRGSVWSLAVTIRCVAFTLRAPRQGLRVVSVNDEGCSSNNFFIRMEKETGCCKNEYADPGTLTQGRFGSTAQSGPHCT